MGTTSSIKGVIKVNGIPDAACFSNFSDLLQSLGTYLSVELPNQTFSNIVISNAQPGQADRDKIWWRLGNSGGFVGIYFYSNSVWVQVFPAPQQIFWLVGVSTTPPAGYSFDQVQNVVTAPTYASLLAMALPLGGPIYEYYPAVYTGI